MSLPDITTSDKGDPPKPRAVIRRAKVLDSILRKIERLNNVRLRVEPASVPETATAPTGEDDPFEDSPRQRKAFTVLQTQARIRRRDLAIAIYGNDEPASMEALRKMLPRLRDTIAHARPDLSLTWGDRYVHMLPADMTRT